MIQKNIEDLSFEEVTDALQRVLSCGPKSQPNVRDAKIVTRSFGLPITIEHKTIRELRVAKGDPTHGAKRSDDYVSKFEVEYPGRCDECGNGQLVYMYSINNMWYGGQDIRCEVCDTTLFEEVWD